MNEDCLCTSRDIIPHARVKSCHSWYLSLYELRILISYVSGIDRQALQDLSHKAHTCIGKIDTWSTQSTHSRLIHHLKNNSKVVPPPRVPQFIVKTVMFMSKGNKVPRQVSDVSSQAINQDPVSMKLLKFQTGEDCSWSLYKGLQINYFHSLVNLYLQIINL